jgi:hypothetical protein
MQNQFVNAFDTAIQIDLMIKDCMTRKVSFTADEIIQKCESAKFFAKKIVSYDVVDTYIQIHMRSFKSYTKTYIKSTKGFEVLFYPDNNNILNVGSNSRVSIPKKLIDTLRDATIENYAKDIWDFKLFRSEYNELFLTPDFMEISSEYKKLTKVSIQKSGIVQISIPENICYFQWKLQKPTKVNVNPVIAKQFIGILIKNLRNS